MSDSKCGYKARNAFLAPDSAEAARVWCRDCGRTQDYERCANEDCRMKAVSADVERRPCTCPDGERPIPCPRKFAVSECQAAAGWTDSVPHLENERE